LPANACGICIAPASNIAAAMVAFMVSSSLITVLQRKQQRSCKRGSQPQNPPKAEIRAGFV
jgi:hypothetical protein